MEKDDKKKKTGTKNEEWVKNALKRASIGELADELKKKMRAEENGENDGLHKCVSWGFEPEVNEAMTRKSRPEE